MMELQMQRMGFMPILRVYTCVTIGTIQNAVETLTLTLKACLHCPTPIPMEMDNVQNCFHWTYTDSYSDSNAFCTQFDGDIFTNKVVF